MKTELQARGFDHLTDARRGTFINEARAELDRMFLWPWREATASGAAPLTVADLGVVGQVVDTTRSNAQLARVDRQTLVEAYGDLTVTGSPRAYFIDWASGSRVVRVYPVSTNSIEVRYWKVTADLTGTDSPASPSEAHSVIVDLAQVRALGVNRSTEERSGLAGRLLVDIDRRVQQLLVQYPPGQAEGPDAYAGVSYASVDW